METVLAFLGENWKTIGVIAAVFVDISPVKINPVKWLLRTVGRLLNTDISRQLQAVKAAQQSQQEAIDHNEMDRIRWEILAFANSCRHGCLHTKDEFQHIIAQRDKYEGLCRKHAVANGVFDSEYEYILRINSRCQDENSYL